jgi:Tol biopolymer transport system component
MSFFYELKRRHVFRVGTGYLALSWLLIQIADTVLPAFGLADVVRVVVLIAAVGLIPVLALTWVFELTPEGLKLDRDVDRSSDSKRRLDKRLDRVAIVVLALAVAYFLFDKLVLEPARDAAFREALLGVAASERPSGAMLGDAVLATDFSGSHRQPTLSPDGSRLAFVRPDSDGIEQLWVMRLPDGVPVQITRAPAPSSSPSWSPTDDNILFQRPADEFGTSIWLVDASGSRAPRLLVPGGSAPRFAPDGQSFVFAMGRKVAVGSVDGSEPRRLEGIPETPGFASPSPAINGAGDIVFVLADGGPVGDLWAFESSSGEFRRLTWPDADWPGVGAESPVWRPDGRRVIYAAPDGDFANIHLWEIDTLSGESVKLTAGPGGYGNPAISGDGARIAYAHARPVWRLRATEPASDQHRTVHESRDAIVLPHVSPDGASVTYFGQDGIYTVPAKDGRAEQRTFDPPGEAVLPFWSRSDGSVLYYKGDSLHRLHPETGLSEAVLDDFAWTEKNWPAIHGRQLAYHLRGSRRTVIRDLESGQERSLEEHLRPKDWSRDGRRLLGDAPGGGLFICVVARFDCEPILGDDGSPLLGARPRWSHDESRIFFRRARQDKPGYAEIWSVAAEGGKARVETEIGPYDVMSMSFGVGEGDVILWNEYEPSGLSEIWITDLDTGR